MHGPPSGGPALSTMTERVIGTKSRSRRSLISPPQLVYNECGRRTFRRLIQIIPLCRFQTIIFSTQTPTSARFTLFPLQQIILVLSLYPHIHMTLSTRIPHLDLGTLNSETIFVTLPDLSLIHSIAKRSRIYKIKARKEEIRQVLSLERILTQEKLVQDYSIAGSTTKTSFPTQALHNSLQVPNLDKSQPDFTSTFLPKASLIEKADCTSFAIRTQYRTTNYLPHSGKNPETAPCGRHRKTISYRRKIICQPDSKLSPQVKSAVKAIKRLQKKMKHSSHHLRLEKTNWGFRTFFFWILSLARPSKIVQLINLRLELLMRTITQQRTWDPPGGLRRSVGM